MIVYGTNPVREALKGPREVHQIWATERVARADWLTAEQVRHVAADEVERECGSSEHQGVCAEVAPYRYVDADALLAPQDALVICLDEVQDPHNLGAVARVVEAAGANGLVLPERRSAEVTPAVCKAAAGAVEHVAIARVGNLADWLGRAKGAQTWIYGAEAREGAIDYGDPDYAGRVVLVLGSEGRGLRPRVAKSCDALVRLPQRGVVDSLNVATAAAALVYGVMLLRR